MIQVIRRMAVSVEPGGKRPITGRIVTVRPGSDLTTRGGGSSAPAAPNDRVEAAGRPLRVAARRSVAGGRGMAGRRRRCYCRDRLSGRCRPSRGSGDALPGHFIIRFIDDSTGCCISFLCLAVVVVVVVVVVAAAIVVADGSFFFFKCQNTEFCCLFLVSGWKMG